MFKKFFCISFIILNLVVNMKYIKGKYSNNRAYLFTSESVTEGHPDKVCDQISDNILDAAIKENPDARVACETFATQDLVLIGGEISTQKSINYEKIARETIKNIGYTNPQFGLDADNCKVLVSINEQSADIAYGVNERENHEQGAGDQGIMFGFACDETPELMPLPISLAHKLAKQLAKVRKEKILPWVLPDGKTQVTVEYINGKPQKIDTIVISTQHLPNIPQNQIREEIIEYVIKPICKEYLSPQTKFLINPSGIFTIGGPQADTGLTGRKIIVDTYGGMGHHGGGCFSGKDPSKVDRSAAYMARYIAKNIVAAGIATKCEVQLSYAIGQAEPVSIYVNTFQTSKIPEEKIEMAIYQIFPLKPKEIIEHLKLKKPIYGKTAAYGHFGREDEEFSWEKTDKVDELRNFLWR